MSGQSFVWLSLLCVVYFMTASVDQRRNLLEIEEGQTFLIIFGPSSVAKSREASLGRTLGVAHQIVANPQPINIPEESLSSSADIDYGGLWIEGAFSRQIASSDEEAQEDYREELLNERDDDEYFVETDWMPDEDIQDVPTTCQRNNWRSKNFPTCNTVFEFALDRDEGRMQNYNVTFRGHGAFRNSWLFLRDRDRILKKEEFIFKSLILDEVSVTAGVAICHCALNRSRPA
jgi:hypothetical protein